MARAVASADAESDERLRHEEWVRRQFPVAKGYREARGASVWSNDRGKIQMNRIRNFLKSEDAIAVTEYGLLVALIAVALIAVVLVFGQNISSWFSKKTQQITTV
jgi:Flp pilus assembly pilin Flp